MARYCVLLTAVGTGCPGCSWYCLLTTGRASGFFFFLILDLMHAGSWGCLTWTRLQQPQEQCYPFLTVRVVFLTVQTKVWLPVLGTFNVRTDVVVNACDCTQGLCRHHKRVCAESWLWEKNPFPHRGIEPASAACQSDALPTELHPRPGQCQQIALYVWPSPCN